MRSPDCLLLFLRFSCSFVSFVGNVDLMKIQEFIQNHLEKRLQQFPCLVVYDPERRYSEIVQDLAVQGCDVINGSASTILGREQAMDAWRALAKSPESKKQVLVYLPIARPRTEEAKQRNPYQIFAIAA